LLWVNGGLGSELAAPEAVKGYMGLKAEGFQIEFRNLKLELLPGRIQ